MRIQGSYRVRVGPLCLLFGIVLAVAGCREIRHIGCRGCPPAPTYPAIDSERALIENLAAAYQRRDYDKFTTLFSNPTLPPPSTQPAYLFILYDPPPGGGTSWGYEEEMRIARRMFRPSDPAPGEPPLSTDFWLMSVNIWFTVLTDFVETTDLYRSPTNPDGLDPARWRATEATYDTEAYFQLAGSTDYLVRGSAKFGVIQDLTKTNADIFKWLIYRWKDLGNSHPFGGNQGNLIENSTWSRVKALYR